MKPSRSTTPGEHVPVMFHQVMQVLNPQSGQTFVDCTLGFAGHASELLRRVGPTGFLFATDLDPDQLPRSDDRLKAIGHPYAVAQSNFAALPALLAKAGIQQVHGVLADLGMSSMQVDDPARGFSFMREGPLDMRMDRTRGLTAADLLATLSEADLAKAFTEFGDEPEAMRIAEAIVAKRKTEPITTTAQLRTLIETTAPVKVIKSPGKGPARKQQLLPATRVFQALRILVNRELANLSQLLRVLPQILAPGGTAAIIAFHSGEDRLVKAAFRDGLSRGEYADACEDALRPTEEEKLENPRGRSAKLRWAKKK